MASQPIHKMPGQKVAQSKKKAAECKHEQLAQLEQLRRVEQALVKSEERYRRITEAVTDYVFSVRISHGRPVETVHNAACVAVTGYTSEDFASDPYLWFRMVHEEDRKAVQEQVNVVLLGQDVQPLEHRIFRKDGVMRWIKNTLVPYCDPQGKLVSYDGLIRDIHEREQAEERLCDSEERYRALFTNNPIETIVVNLEGKVTDFNKAKDESAGKREGDRLPKRGDRMYTEDYAGKHQIDMRSELMECIRSNKSKQFAELKYKNRFLSVRISPFSDGAIITSIDITEQKQAEKDRKELEAQLQQAQKMEAIGTLAGGIAHDFNNILAAVMGHAELAQLDAPEGGRLRTHFTQVLHATNRAKDLVNQILTFSRQGKQERKPLQLGPIVKQTIRMLRASIPATIDIRQNIRQGSGMVLADPTQINQVLMNLSTNAAHAMGAKGGVLEFSLEHVGLDAETAAKYQDLKPGPYEKLTVSDTGHGMDDAVKERIFDPYFTTKEKDVGTGLGLAAVHGIVKNCGGSICVFSQPGKGTTFQIFFPETTMKTEEETQITEFVPKGHEHIMFVDDEEVLADVGQQMLERLGYTVERLTSPIEALEVFRAEPDKFELIITDQTMPHVTGETFAKELMSIRHDVPVVICTGYGDLIPEDKAKGIGIRRVVAKPYSLRDLATTIREVLDQNY